MTNGKKKYTNGPRDAQGPRFRRSVLAYMKKKHIKKWQIPNIFELHVEVFKICDQIFNISSISKVIYVESYVVGYVMFIQIVQSSVQCLRHVCDGLVFLLFDGLKLEGCLREIYGLGA